MSRQRKSGGRGAARATSSSACGLGAVPPDRKHLSGRQLVGKLATAADPEGTVLAQIRLSPQELAAASDLAQYDEATHEFVTTPLHDQSKLYSHYRVKSAVFEFELATNVLLVGNLRIFWHPDPDIVINEHNAIAIGMKTAAAYSKVLNVSKGRRVRIGIPATQWMFTRGGGEDWRFSHFGQFLIVVQDPIQTTATDSVTAYAGNLGTLQFTYAMEFAGRTAELPSYSGVSLDSTPYRAATNPCGPQAIFIKTADYTYTQCGYTPPSGADPDTSPGFVIGICAISDGGTLEGAAMNTLVLESIEGGSLGGGRPKILISGGKKRRTGAVSVDLDETYGEDFASIADNIVKSVMKIVGGTGGIRRMTGDEDWLDVALDVGRDLIIPLATQVLASLDYQTTRTPLVQKFAAAGQERPIIPFIPRTYKWSDQGAPAKLGYDPGTNYYISGLLANGSSMWDKARSDLVSQYGDPVVDLLSRGALIWFVSEWDFFNHSNENAMVDFWESTVNGFGVLWDRFGLPDQIAPRASQVKLPNRVDSMPVLKHMAPSLKPVPLCRSKSFFGYMYDMLEHGAATASSLAMFVPYKGGRQISGAAPVPYYTTAASQLEDFPYLRWLQNGNTKYAQFASCHGSKMTGHLTLVGDAATAYDFDTSVDEIGVVTIDPNSSDAPVFAADRLTVPCDFYLADGVGRPPWTVNSTNACGFWVFPRAVGAMINADPNALVCGMINNTTPAIGGLHLVHVYMQY